MTGLIGLALTLSVYLSWHDLVGGSVIGCGGGSPCEQVLSSRWSTIGGVLPVSGLAAGVYLATLVASFFIGPATAPPVRRLAWGAMLVLVGSAAGSAVWFTILQKWIIGAFCPYCMATHITGMLLAVLVIWQALMPWRSSDVIRLRSSFHETSDGNRDEPRNHNRLTTIGPVLVGLALAGGLAAFQVVLAPPPVYLGGESQESLPAIDPNAGPIVGSSEAPYIVTLLFDYTCPHCQRVHFMLGEVVRRYEGRLAFALCPAPLDRQCNPYITRDVEEFKDSCELVKIALAVWVARREAFGAFEDWMFSFESGDRWRPRSLDAARAEAVDLAGQAKFDAARADPWIDRYLETSIRIYGQTIRSGHGGVPKLVFGSRWVIPEPDSADDLVTILQDSLGVPRFDFK
jgi:uncharacterized membrane protein/protein-disulfide isomerase